MSTPSRSVRSSTGRRCRPYFSAAPEDHAEHDQRGPDQPQVAGGSLDRVLEQHPEDADRQRADDHVPGQPVVQPAGRGVAQPAHPGRDQPPDVRPEVDEDGGLGAELGDRGERGARVVVEEDPGDDPQVGRGGDRQELGQPLDESRGRSPRASSSARVRNGSRMTGTPRSPPGSPGSGRGVRVRRGGPPILRGRGTATPGCQRATGLPARARHHDLGSRHRRRRGRASLLAFLDAGGTLVDTADVYADGEAEAILGGLFADVIPRTEVVLATKAGARREDGPFGGGASRSSLLGSLDASLERMGTDYVDLWQLHAWDPEVPLDETLSAIDLAVSSGRVRYAGVANYAGWQVAAAARSAGLPLVSVQSEYSLLERGVEDEVLPAASYHGHGPAPVGSARARGAHRQVPRRHPARLPRRVRAPRALRRARTAPSAPRGSCRPWSPPRTGSGPHRSPSRWRGCATGPAWSPRWSAPATAPSCWARSRPRS